MHSGPLAAHTGLRVLQCQCAVSGPARSPGSAGSLALPPSLRSTQGSTRTLSSGDTRWASRGSSGLLRSASSSLVPGPGRVSAESSDPRVLRVCSNSTPRGRARLGRSPPSSEPGREEGVRSLPTGPRPSRPLCPPLCPCSRTSPRRQRWAAVRSRASQRGSQRGRRSPSSAAGRLPLARRLCLPLARRLCLPLCPSPRTGRSKAGACGACRSAPRRCATSLSLSRARSVSYLRLDAGEGI